MRFYRVAYRGVGKTKYGHWYFSRRRTMKEFAARTYYDLEYWIEEMGVWQWWKKRLTGQIRQCKP